MGTPPPASTLPCLRWSGMTHRGNFRSNNEDVFLALTLSGLGIQYLGKTGEMTIGGNDFIFAVSDGMGGERSGEFASRLTLERITKLMPGIFRLGAMGIESGFVDILTELFVKIHQDMIYMGRCYEECENMGATLSLCWFTPGWLYFGHVGDCRIYYLPKDGGLQQITHDHTHVGHLRRTGRLNEREARVHPRRNALQQSLGSGTQFLEPQVGSVGCREGDRFLLCSDGLVDGLWDRNLEEIIRQPTPEQAAKPPAQALIEASLQVSGRDNLTAIVVEVLPPASP